MRLRRANVALWSEWAPLGFVMLTPHPHLLLTLMNFDLMTSKAYFALGGENRSPGSLL